MSSTPCDSVITADDVIGLWVQYAVWLSDHLTVDELNRHRSPPQFFNCVRKLSKRYVIEEVVTSRVPNEPNVRAVVRLRLDRAGWLGVMGTLVSEWLGVLGTLVSGWVEMH